MFKVFNSIFETNKTKLIHTSDVADLIFQYSSFSFVYWPPEKPQMKITDAIIMKIAYSTFHNITMRFGHTKGPVKILTLKSRFSFNGHILNSDEDDFLDKAKSHDIVQGNMVQHKETPYASSELHK